MPYLLRLTTGQCFYNHWIPYGGVYWATSGVQLNRKAEIRMSHTGGNCPGSSERHDIRVGESANFSGGDFKVDCVDPDQSEVTIRIWTKAELDALPTYEPKPQITAYSRDKNLVNVSALLGTQMKVKNTGGKGVIHMKIGIGYIDSYNEYILTGTPRDDSYNLNTGQTFQFNANLKIEPSDYHAQQGTGWAYSPQAMKVIFLAGIEDGGDIKWTADNNLNIVLNPVTADPVIDPTPEPDPTPDPDIDPDPDPDPAEDDKSPFWLYFIIASYIGFIGYTLYAGK